MNEDPKGKPRGRNGGRHRKPEEEKVKTKVLYRRVPKEIYEAAAQLLDDYVMICKQ